MSEVNGKSAGRQRSLHVAFVPALLMALLPKCPLCLAAYASVLGVAGTEAVRSARWVLPLTAVMLAVNAGLLLMRAVRRRAPIGPVWLSVLGALGVLGSRLLTESQLGTWAGVSLVVAASLWSALELSLRRRTG